MFIILSISSKNSDSLTKFLKFFYKLKKTKNLKLKLYTKQSQKENKNSFLSVLKSPHVNKKSQEQFEYNVYGKQLKLEAYQLNKFLFI
jgi:ribosomal protein S10